jgi:nitroreductase
MIQEMIRSRRSIRQFKPEHPGRPVIEELIEAAVAAPSASNKQPWRFFVIDDRGVIQSMAEKVQAAIDRLAGHVEESFMNAFKAYGDYFVRFHGAPVVIVPVYKKLVVLSHIVDSEIIPTDHLAIQNMESNSGLISVSLAIQNLMLCAHAKGLGTSCMTGPLVAEKELQSLLGIPEEWHIAAVIPVGFPAETPAPVPRKSVDAVTRWVPKAAEK